jgi:hypothetical protein
VPPIGNRATLSKLFVSQMKVRFRRAWEGNGRCAGFAGWKSSSLRNVQKENFLVLAARTTGAGRGMPRADRGLKPEEVGMETRENMQRSKHGGNGDLSRQNIEESLEAAREKMNEYGRILASFVKERPGTALVLALGAGYLIGRILRR